MATVNRYTFTDPYAPKHNLELAADSLAGVVEEERRRRQQEIENQQRDLNLSFEGRRVGLLERGFDREGTLEGFDPQTGEYDPGRSRAAFLQRQGHGFDLERDATRNRYGIDAEVRERGYEMEDRNRRVRNLIGAGAPQTGAGALAEDPRAYEYLHPSEIDPRMIGMRKELMRFESDLNMREDANRARLGGRGFGRSGLARDYLPGLRSRIDDLTTDIAREERLMPTRPPIGFLPGSPQEESFVADSSSRAGRIQELRNLRDIFGRQHDAALEDALGLEEGALTGHEPAAEDDFGETVGGGNRAIGRFTGKKRPPPKKPATPNVNDPEYQEWVKKGGRFD